MKKLHCHTIAFNDMSLVEEAIRLFREQHADWKNIPYVLVDAHWPIDKEKSKFKLREIADNYNLPIIDPGKNRGVDGNWNFVISEMGLKDGDVLVGCDPDGRALQNEWASALMEVFNERDEMYYGACNENRFYTHGWHNCSEEHALSSGLKYLTFSRIVAWSLGGFDIGWVKRVGGIKQLSKHYGGIEDEMHGRCRPHGGNFFKLKDYYDKHIYDVHVDYVSWKKHQARFAIGEDIDFESWLKREGKFIE